MPLRSKRITFWISLSLVMAVYSVIMYSFTINTVKAQYLPDQLSAEQLVLQDQLRSERQDRMAEIQEVVLPDNTIIYLDAVDDSSGIYRKTMPIGYDNPLYLSQYDKNMIAQLQSVESVFGIMPINKYQKALDGFVMGTLIGLLCGLFFSKYALRVSGHKKSLSIGIVLSIVIPVFIVMIAVLQKLTLIPIPTLILMCLGSISTFFVAYAYVCLSEWLWSIKEVEQTMVRT